MGPARANGLDEGDRTGDHLGWRFLSFVLLFLAIVFLGPSPLVDLSALVLARLYEPAAPAVVVVGIDQLTLRHYGLGWPLPYEYFARALGNAACFGPRGIFVDIEFLQSPAQQPRMQQLRDADHSIQAGTYKCDDGSTAPKVTVLYGKTRSEEGNGFADPQLKLRMLTMFISTETSHRLRYEWQVAQSPTPVPRLFRLLCPSASDRSGPCDKPHAEILHAAESPSEQDAIELRIPERLPPGDEVLEAHWRPECGNAEGPSSAGPSSSMDLSAPIRNVAAMGYGVARDYVDDVLLSQPRVSIRRPDPMEACPPALTLPFERVTMAYRSDIEVLRSAIRGRIVLFGLTTSNGDPANFAGNRTFPGVYAHAVALQELADYGDDYPRVRTIMSYFGILAIAVVTLYGREVVAHKMRPVPIGGSAAGAVPLPATDDGRRAWKGLALHYLSSVIVVVLAMLLMSRLRTGADMLAAALFAATSLVFFGDDTISRALSALHRLLGRPWRT